MPLINTSQLTAMSAGATDQFVAILDDFLATGRDSLARLEALEEGQFDTATSIAHQLKGASGTLGLEDFHLLAAECEQNLKQEVSMTQEQLLRLKDLLEVSVNAAREFLQTTA